MNLFKRKNPDGDCVDFIKMAEQISRDSSDVPGRDARKGPAAKGGKRRATGRNRPGPGKKQGKGTVSAGRFLVALFLLYLLCLALLILLDSV